MEDKNLVNKPVDVKRIIDFLHHIKVETGTLMCLGCGYEHHCGIHGCAIMNMAADRMTNDQIHIAALQKEIDKLRSGRRWIPVTERLPDQCMDILVVYRDKHILMGTAMCDDWIEEDLEDEKITHWMPVPDAPEVE